MTPAVREKAAPFWSWLDAVLFLSPVALLFVFPLVTKRASAPAPKPTLVALVLEFVIFGIWFLVLGVYFRMKYDAPLFPSLGWRLGWPKPINAVWLGPVMALTLGVAGKLLGAPELDPLGGAGDRSGLCCGHGLVCGDPGPSGGRADFPRISAAPVCALVRGRGRDRAGSRTLCADARATVRLVVAVSDAAACGINGVWVGSGEGRLNRRFDAGACGIQSACSTSCIWHNERICFPRWSKQSNGVTTDGGNDRSDAPAARGEVRHLPQLRRGSGRDQDDGDPRRSGDWRGCGNGRCGGGIARFRGGIWTLRLT